MKRAYLLIFIITLCFAFIINVSAAISSADNSNQILSSSQAGLVVELNTPSFRLETEFVEGVEYKRLQIPGWGVTGEIGKPELPVLSKIIALPDLAGVHYSLEILETEVVSDVDMYPLQAGETDTPTDEAPAFSIDDAFYRANEHYPAERVRISDPVIMRDLRMVQITFSPFSYNPVERELRVIRRMRVSVEFNPGEGANPKLHRRDRIGSSFASMYRQVTMNYDDLFLDQIEERGGYIFVVSDNSYASQIQALVDWKLEKGFPVDVVSTSNIGTSMSAIKNYIENAYYNWDNPPEFVVLVGDMNGSITIATDHFNCGWFDNAVTDHYYAKLEGNDIFPDIMVGRLSVRSTNELATVVNKIIQYESGPYLGTDWFTRALMIADYGHISCKLTKQYCKSKCLQNGYTQVDTAWFSWSAPITTISNSVNNGVGIVNFRGYIDWGGWGTSQIYALNNAGRIPVVFGNTCETGSFEISTCISEAWLRAGSPTNPEGGVGCVGPSSWNTHTRWNNCIDSGFFTGMFDEGLEYYMQIIIRGKLELWNNFPYNLWGNNTNSVEAYYHVYNLIGDPGLSVWTAHPAEMTVNIPGDIPLGSNYYPVSVEDEFGDPIEGAYVNLWKGSEVYVGGYTDEFGAINIPIEPANAGEMKVCVTKQNHHPFRQIIQIVSGELFLGVIETDIDDDNTPPSSGNGDGVFNPGETVEIDFRIENFGSENVSGVTGEISISDPLVNVITSSASFGDLNAGSTVWSTAPFVVELSPACSHDWNLEIGITLTDNLAREWTSMIMFEVESADLHARTHELPGAGTNGLLDPGETSTMIVTLENWGTYTSETLTGNISCESDLIEISDAEGTFNPISPGTQGNNSGDPFEVSTPVDTYPGTQVTLTLVLSGPNGFTDTTCISMDLGIPDDDDPMVQDTYGYYCYDNSDVNYSPAPTYQWVEVSGLTNHLNLPDYGDEQDCSIRVDFPPGFSFRYYGQDYDVITVCSNGWAALGLTYMCNFRNWPITGAQVAPACLAAFWDDLRMSSGGGSNGKVYAYFDEANHRFIIEWKQVTNADAGYATETFEIILYDPVHYPTPTGDGIIDFQYQTVVNTGSEYNATVGICTPDNGDGVQYTYANQYPPGAPDLHNNMAIRFTTEGNTGWDPPIIGISPSPLIIDVPIGGSASSPLTISNSGGLTLIYNISLEYDQSSSEGACPVMVVPGGAGTMDDLGGPDCFGYTWIDSDEPGGPAYDWVDISGIGTPIIFVHNDSTTAEIPIGFTFPFYNQEFSEFILSANGWISFTSHSGAWSNLELPDPEAPPNLISGFWDDLDPLQTGAEVLAWDNGTDSLVVSFLSVPHWGFTTVGTYTFQMILTADGDISCQYQSLSGDYESCTVGIQNSDGTDGLCAAFNEQYLHENLVVCFYHPFLRVEPLSGFVGPNSSGEVNVFAYGYGMEQGTYNAELGIDSNDPQTPHVDVPLIINIGGGGPGPLQVTMEPENPPIILPPSGGSFNYTVEITNICGVVQGFDFWLMAELPNGSTYGPIILRTGLSLPPGGNISRFMTQQVPPNATAGDYYYHADVGFYPDSIIASTGFNFNKAGVDGSGSELGGWHLYGWGDEAFSMPEEFAFRGVWPNPFNPVTEVVFELPRQSGVEIIVYDVLGRRIAVLQDGVLSAGSHKVRWNASNLASGVYFLRFNAGDYHATSKLLLLK